VWAGKGGTTGAGTMFMCGATVCGRVCRVIMSQGYFSSTRQAVVLNVYLAPPSWCLASADQAEAVANTLLNSTLSVFLIP
jgi:hypothetical protein